MVHTTRARRTAGALLALLATSTAMEAALAAQPGEPLGAEVLLVSAANTQHSYDLFDLAQFPNGDLLLAWAGDGGVSVQRFSAAGAALGPAVKVSDAFQSATVAIGPGAQGAIALSADCGPLSLQPLGSDGKPRGAAVAVAGSGATGPAVAVDNTGRIGIAWRNCSFAPGLVNTTSDLQTAIYNAQGKPALVRPAPDLKPDTAAAERLDPVNEVTDPSTLGEMQMTWSRSLGFLLGYGTQNWNNDYSHALGGIYVRMLNPPATVLNTQVEVDYGADGADFGCIAALPNPTQYMVTWAAFDYASPAGPAERMQRFNNGTTAGARLYPDARCESLFADASGDLVRRESGQFSILAQSGQRLAGPTLLPVNSGAMAAGRGAEIAYVYARRDGHGVSSLYLQRYAGSQGTP